METAKLANLVRDIMVSLGDFSKLDTHFVTVGQCNGVDQALVIVSNSG